MIAEKKVYKLSDQEEFALISGDYNPLHLDRVSSRKSVVGQPVVHGVHIVLWALDNYVREIATPISIVNLSISFSSPVAIGEEVYLDRYFSSEDEVELRVMRSNSLVTTIRMAWSYGKRKESYLKSCLFLPKAEAADLDATNIRDARGSLQLSYCATLISKRFPMLQNFLSRSQLATIIAASRITGMKCPGLRALFFSLKLSFHSDHGGESLHYKVGNYDRRFNFVEVDIDGPQCTGIIKAFLRPMPILQASYQSVKQIIQEGEFEGQRALVIGGSRGLGEAATKILCAGGAKVWFTYCNGQPESERLFVEITADGGSVRYSQFDVINTKHSMAKLTSDKKITHLYYCATPFIRSNRDEGFSADLFNYYCKFYVSGFISAVEHIKGPNVRGIFFPSTKFLDDIPLNMNEYIAAKAAGESICRIVQENNDGLYVHHPRLPVVETDQTANIYKRKVGNTTDILVDEIRLLNKKSALRKHRI